MFTRSVFYLPSNSLNLTSSSALSLFFFFLIFPNMLSLLFSQPFPNFPYINISPSVLTCSLSSFSLSHSPASELGSLFLARRANLQAADIAAQRRWPMHAHANAHVMSAAAPRHGELK